MKKFTKKRYFRTAICFGVGAVLLTAAVFANYDNANGYSVCKGALKGLLFETNFTADHHVEMKLDGQTVASNKGRYMTNGGGNPKRYNYDENAQRYSLDEELQIDIHEMIQQDGKSIDTYTEPDGTKWSYSYEDYEPTVNGSVVEEEDGSIIGRRGSVVEKAINFGETLCDTLVGDLKNSFILTEEKEGIRTYNVSLTGSQMPDLVSSGTSLLVSTMREGIEQTRRERLEHPEYYEDYMSLDDLLYDNLFSGGDPIIENLDGVMAVNEQGLPTLLHGVLTVTGFDGNGQGHSLELLVHIDLSEYGTTQIQHKSMDEFPNLMINTSNGGMRFVLNTEASEEDQQKVMERAKEYASYGNTIVVIDQNGNEYARIQGEDTEALED